MVFLSAPLWLRNRITDRYWRVQEVLKHARVIRTFAGRCGRDIQLVLKHFYVFSFQLWINRITAASQEHGLKYPAFILNLIKCQVELNRKVLADLAIYEPKTFKSLAALSKRRREEGFVAALGDGKEPEGIFSRVAQHH
ncbi:PREDICTED: 39S ribosomal protein L20, mitochondrial [Bison bison bison]|uniref:Large ribosomal subunit protein bL20m n=1 Tax=Bison bison bison TaxID=43346 RepID=A0A6P3I934_BISBB|nr:PREDICTED: 39S ribosomal protein L20, mitochondrial [Bison bison bison]